MFRWADWITEHEPFAFGPLELKPKEFRRMTPAEFGALYKGWVWRTRAAEDTACAWVCLLINHMGTIKQPLQPVRVLGRPMVGMPNVGDDS